MAIDFARLNYVLIPKSREDRERILRGRLGRVGVRLTYAWLTLTEEGRLALIVTFVVGAFSLDVRRTSAYMLFAILSGVLSGSIAAIAFYRPRGLTAALRGPARVTVGEPATFELECALPKGDRGDVLRARGPFLTWDGRWLGAAPRDRQARGGDRVRFTFRATFRACGEHDLGPFTASRLVPLGLARGTLVRTPDTRLMVVPRVASVRRLDLPTAQRHQPGGVALASKSGEAMDLFGVRPYRPGDPVRDLHARSWARTGTPIVREYQQEYFTRVGVVLETATADEDLLARAVELTAGIIASLSRGEALVDVLVVGDAVHDLTLGRSLGTLEQALDLLACVTPQQGATGDTALARLRPFLGRLSSVVVVALGENEGSLALERGISAAGVPCKTVRVAGALRAALDRREEVDL